MLAQTYERIEVVIVGDAAAPEIERAVKSVGDPRVRYYNLPMRGPVSTERAELLWYVAGGPPSNEAMRLSRGRWIAGMDDDDVSLAGASSCSSKAARKRDLEFCYGQILRATSRRKHDRLVCDFPPAVQKRRPPGIAHARGDEASSARNWAMRSSSVPGDWSRVRRMMRIGVRMGMIDNVVVDYYRGPGWQTVA